jgi:hypothetical protein
VLLLDLSLTIVDVIELVMGIIWVIDDQSTTQAIAILVLEVTVVPVRPLRNTTDQMTEIVLHPKFITAWSSA